MNSALCKTFLFRCASVNQTTLEPCRYLYANLSSSLVAPAPAPALPGASVLGATEPLLLPAAGNVAALLGATLLLRGVAYLVLRGVRHPGRGNIFRSTR